MSVLETLVAARKLIETPSGWMQGKYQENGAYCMAGALYISTRDGATLSDCLNALRDVVDEDSLVHFNDTAGRTHPEVLAAFDEAINRATRTS